MSARLGSISARIAVAVLAAIAVLVPAASLAFGASEGSDIRPGGSTTAAVRERPHADLECAEITYSVTTGTDAGECLIDRGDEANKADKAGKAMCLDLDSNAAYARCDGGCIASNGRGSCFLKGEDPAGGELLLACESGDRYLLRTGTGKGICRGETGRTGRTARCSDTKNHSSEASCKGGCLRARGAGLCAKYKKDVDR